MSITSTIQGPNDTDARGLAVLCIGASRVLIGDHVGTFDTDANDAGYPTTLVNGDTVDDDVDRDELRGALRALGFDVETDDTGLVLVQRGGA